MRPPLTFPASFLVLASVALACAPSEAKPARKPPTEHGPRAVAMLGAGCFWGVEAWMLKADGVVSIDVGYAGGKADKVSYDQVSTGKTGFAETARIVYDPSVTSYEKLLLWFFKIHDPTTLDRQGNDVGSQYRSVIFPLNKDQMKTAVNVRWRVASSGAWKKPITTTIEPNPKWVRAEDYHQDYLIKHPGGYDNHWERPIQF